MKATTIAPSREDGRLLSRAARERGISRSELIRQHLAIVLEQYRRHPEPRSAEIVRALTERGDERELFSAGVSRFVGLIPTTSRQGPIWPVPQHQVARLGPPAMSALRRYR